MSSSGSSSAPAPTPYQDRLISKCCLLLPQAHQEADLTSAGFCRERGARPPVFQIMSDRRGEWIYFWR